MDRSKFVPKAKVVRRKEYLTDLARGKKVLNVGMGGFIDDPDKTSGLATVIERTLHAMVHEVAREITGVDVNPQALAIMSKAVPGCYVEADITGFDAAKKIGGLYELILFGEVIEHLDCFRDALGNLRTLLSHDGLLVITTVNAYNAEAILKHLFRYESVHEEHTCYFSYLTMKRLLEMNDFVMFDFKYCFQTRYGGSLANRIGYHAMRGIAALLPQFAQGIIVHARPVRES